jgi:hypothetical protein
MSESKLREALEWARGPHNPAYRVDAHDHGKTLADEIERLTLSAPPSSLERELASMDDKVRAYSGMVVSANKRLAEAEARVKELEDIAYREGVAHGAWKHDAMKQLSRAEAAEAKLAALSSKPDVERAREAARFVYLNDLAFVQKNGNLGVWFEWPSDKTMEEGIDVALAAAEAKPRWTDRLRFTEAKENPDGSYAEWAKERGLTGKMKPLAEAKDEPGEPGACPGCGSLNACQGECVLPPSCNCTFHRVSRGDKPLLVPGVCIFPEPSPEQEKK